MVLYFLKSKFQIVEFVELIVTYFMEQFPMLVIDLFQVHQFNCIHSQPCFKGHEAGGVVVEIGSAVSDIKVGDKVAIGVNML